MGVDDFPEVEVEGLEQLGIAAGGFFGELEGERAGLGGHHEGLGNPLDRLEELLVCNWECSDERRVECKVRKDA